MKKLSPALVGLILILTATVAAPLQARPQGSPLPSAIPLEQIGSEAQQRYQGDGIGITPTKDGAHLRAIMQDLEAEATPDGLWLISTAEEDDAHRTRFRVKAMAVGRAHGGASEPLSDDGFVNANSGLATFTRPGLREEYSVGTDGVRQDFVLPQRPPGTGHVTVELSVSGANVENAAFGAKLTLTGGGREIAYSRLHVTDATGRKLSSRMEVGTKNTVRIMVEDAAAVYPVRIDPTFSDADWVNLGGGVAGVNGTVQAMTVDSAANLYVAGQQFTAAGTVPVNNIAKWDGSAWTALGSGLTGQVLSLAASGTQIYAGGSFSTTNGAPSNNIAKWDGSAWQALGTGTGGTVLALAVSGTDLYAGGSFTTAGGAPASRIARWNGSAWSEPGAGVGGTVRALAFVGSQLYAAGDFLIAGGAAANRIARWDGSVWTTPGTGLNNTVNALAVSGSDLYAGGTFTNAGGTAVGRIARWNGTAWSALGSGAFQEIHAMTWVGSSLYIGGNLSSAGGINLSNIARWNGTAWAALGSGLSGGVKAIAAVGGTVFAGGGFNASGTAAMANLAGWNGTVWSPLTPGTNGTVTALAVSGTDLYAAGWFTMIGGTNAKYVAKWNGSVWSPLGSGLDNVAYALAVSGSNLYVGGIFTTAGGLTVNGIARWNGTSWQAMGSGFDERVYALATSGTTVYAGGSFDKAGAVTVNSIARWNGSSWSALGIGMAGGLNGNVTALAVSGSTLYAGGDFATAGGVTVNQIASWNGSAWSALGSGMAGGAAYTHVAALAVSGSNVYAGGDFATAGGVTVNNIARWTGTAWQALGRGVNSDVSTLLATGDSLLVGGAFGLAGGVPAAYLARWSGYGWSALTPGPIWSGDMVTDGTNLYVGTSVNIAGGRVLSGVVSAPLPGPASEAVVYVSETLSTAIASGDITPSIADGTVVGSVLAPGGSSGRMWTLANTGDLGLTVGAISFTGPHAADFTVVTPPAASLAPGAFSNFTFHFTPSHPGVRSATLNIITSDTPDSPYTIALQGTGLTALQVFEAAMASVSLTGANAAPTAIPYHDGITNLLKYASNLNLRRADHRQLTPETGTAGLPNSSIANGLLRMEFLRRIGSGLIYTPQFSGSLQASDWVALTDTPTTTPINAQWERLVYEEPLTGAAGQRIFARVQVTLP